jgi:hypothetical protein
MPNLSLLPKKTLLFILIISFFAFYSPGIIANQNGAVGGVPANPRDDNPRSESIFVHTANHGDQIRDAVRVVNNTDKEKSVLVYATDSQRSSGGAFACKQRVEQRNDVGKWIVLDKDEVTLAPKTSEVVTFTINVPENANVGESNGCIVIQDKEQTNLSSTGSSAITISTRSAIRVLVQIPGDIKKKLTINSFQLKQNSQGKDFITLQLENIGNVSIDAYIDIKMKNIFGIVEQTFGGKYSVLRNDTSDFNFEVQKPFWGGFYNFELEVKYDQNPDNPSGIETNPDFVFLTESLNSIFLFPIQTAIIIITIVILLMLIISGLIIFLYIKNKKFYDLVKSTWVQYTVKQGDEIRSLALTANIDWKLLAKANKLKSPYYLEQGTILLLPPQKEN